MRRTPASKNYLGLLYLYGAALLVCLVVPVTTVNKVRGAFLLSPESYRTTAGMVIRSAAVPNAMKGFYNYDIAYRYTVAGKTYTSTQVSFGKDNNQGIWLARKYTKRYPLGQQVAVFYLSDEPDFSVLEPNEFGSTKAVIIIHVVIIVTAFGGVWWCLRGMLLQKRKATTPNPMSQQFFFHYDSDDNDRFEIPEVGGEYGALIECDRELLAGWGLWSSFVAQYRAERPTSEDLGEEYISTEEPSSEEDKEALLDYTNWGPSAFFEAYELRQWALRWIEIIEMLNDSDAKEVFPDDPHLHRQRGSYGRDWMVGELEEMIEMAECAIRHNVRLTMSQLLD